MIKCGVCTKKFKPKHDTCTTTQLVCSCKCAVIYYNGHKPKGKRLARAVAAMVGRRSMAEVKFDATYLEGKRINAKYEANTFEYAVAETHKYTPDWTLVLPAQIATGTRMIAHTIYIEFKGVLDGVTRKKMKLVKSQYPDLDIRFVFERASNKIYKGSKTTYGMWADKHGFPWADNTLPKEWIK